ncbi:olfactory receptor 11L1-like [Bombina bombina]|uniref:olfactory receptor 11L1-like n=1 Tax=Bombina bombina TaxID=8345 RepID=UPI00235A6A1F|nr:olfactory receptor 11L1-like [Bombina bombina]
MTRDNITVVKEFFLVGFSSIKSCNILLFIIFLMIYCMTLLGNSLISVLVSISHNLKSPMYIFLLHLSLADLLLTINIAPNMLYIVLMEGGYIDIAGCITQFYLLGCSGITECLLLTVMSYDRYLAICNPLRYRTIMNSSCCYQLVTCCWSCGFSLMLVTVILVSRLQFCGHIINYLFCDLTPLLEMACSDTYTVEIENIIVAVLVTLFPSLFILITYVCILLTILRISSSTGRHKAFSTCSSHLIVVCMYYGSLVTIYVFPSRINAMNIKKVLSLLYTLVTPFFNPIIYSLRNQEIIAAIRVYIVPHSIN